MLQFLNLQRGHRLLDVGCGIGDDAREMARLVGESGRVVGLDSSQVMIAEAQKRSESWGLPVEFVVGDAENLDFPTESFDACRSERTLIHVNAEQALDEMIRVTKPGGSLVVFDLDAEGISFDNSRPALTRKILQFHSGNYRNGTIGRQLPRLFKERRLVDVTFRPHSVVCPFSFFKRIYSGVLIKAQEEEVITATESMEWFNEAVQAERRGMFLFVTPGFIVAGRKPTQGITV
jgi:SAM-dependent methyltransferase